MVFLGIVCKIILKYSKKLLDYKVKNTKTYIIIRLTIQYNTITLFKEGSAITYYSFLTYSYNESQCIKIIFPIK